MTILNALYTSGGKMTHKSFREVLVRDLIILSHEENVTASGVSRGRPSPFSSQLSCLKVKHSQHWPSKGKQRRCCVCSLKKDMEHAVLLQQMWRRSVHSELLWEVAHAWFHNLIILLWQCMICFVHCRFCCAVLNGDVQSQPLLAELQALFALLLYSRCQAISPTRLLTVARPPGFQPAYQQDSSEFLMWDHNYFYCHVPHCNGLYDVKAEVIPIHDVDIVIWFVHYEHM